MRQFLWLEAEKTRIKVDLENTENQLAVVRKKLAAEMFTEKIQSTNIDGHTVYLKTNRWIKWSDGYPQQEDRAGALKLTELGWIVQEAINHNRLRSAVLEILDSGRELPPELSQLVEVEKQLTVESRKAQ